jgi:hypothetical protein
VLSKFDRAAFIFVLVRFVDVSGGESGVNERARARTAQS